MCAISGILNYRSSEEAERIIRQMTDAQAHRGPDAEGFFSDEAVALGHRRLSVIDLETGRQPMTRGDITVVLNGEIYNYRDLRRELELIGHHFSSQSDTEVLIHLYEQMGSEFLPLLSGMFVFAVYDRSRKRVLMARDRLGKKPLVYFLHKNSLIFASELCGLKKHPDMSRDIDVNAVSDFLSLQYIPEPNTIYRKVKKLPPGYLLDYQLDSGTLSLRSYWHVNFSFKPQDLQFQDAVHELRGLVEKSVKKRLVADVPLGVFLSGGIDSTIVAATAAKLLAPRRCDAYTAGFSDALYDERSSARRAAEHIRQLPGVELVCHEEVISPGSFDQLTGLLRQIGQPFADASILPTAQLCRFARRDITVALSGDGADELFCGYDRYVAMKILRQVEIFSPLLRRGLFGTAAPLLPDKGERTISGRLRRLFSLLSDDGRCAYFDLLDRCPPSVKNSLFGAGMRDAVRHDSSEVFSRVEPDLTARDREERCSELDVFTYLPGDILPKMDTASMSCGLEVRSPFLDREVVEFAASLPMNCKLHGTDRKHILKKAFADVIPAELRKRPKRGFGVPVARWLREDWHDRAQSALFDGDLCRGGFIDGSRLAELWSSHQNGQRDWSYLLLSLLALAIFLDNEKSA